MPNQVPHQLVDTTIFGTLALAAIDAHSTSRIFCISNQQWSSSYLQRDPRKMTSRLPHSTFYCFIETSFLRVFWRFRHTEQSLPNIVLPGKEAWMELIASKNVINKNKEVVVGLISILWFRHHWIKRMADAETKISKRKKRGHFTAKGKRKGRSGSDRRKEKTNRKRWVFSTYGKRTIFCEGSILN